MNKDTIIKYRKKDTDFNKLKEKYTEIWEVVEPDYGSNVPVIWYCCRGLKTLNEVPINQTDTE